jgi:putative membrane protein
LLVAGAVAYLRGSFWIVLIFSVIFITPAIIRHIIFVQTVYTLTTIKIEVRTGLFSKNSRNIPLRHIQDVYVSETFKERMLGIGDVVIDTAATESKMSLDNINQPRKYADMILDQLQNWN